MSIPASISLREENWALKKSHNNNGNTPFFVFSHMFLPAGREEGVRAEEFMMFHAAIKRYDNNEKDDCLEPFISK